MSEKEKIKIDYMLIGNINPAKYNPRVISEEELLGLIESVKKFGVVDPFIFNQRTLTLVGGHQRLKACERLGYTEVPVVKVDLSPAEEKALNCRDWMRRFGLMFWRRIWG